ANFVNMCINIEVEGTNVTAAREIDGGNEIINTNLPLVVAGQKGIVEESDLRIPNMRGIMQARSKPLKVKEPINTNIETKITGFSKPDSKGAVKLVDNVDELINLLHNEAKVI
ncbi:MAG: electron transfer flavoprotein subunit alpha, partial [Flavobacteriaceae bacterium]|nr:electron transfer flavoprotein subunit alpha [Flavobacteriaceae bacterium]